MYTRLDEVPVYQSRDGQIPAVYYNHVQVAFKRLGRELRFPVPRLKHMDLILQPDAWIIVDRVLNDVPIVAWSDFQVSRRSSLHEPIACRIRFYHAHAPLIMRRTLEAMDLILGEMLEAAAPTDNASVSPLKKPPL